MLQEARKTAAQAGNTAGSDVPVGRSAAPPMALVGTSSGIRQLRQAIARMAPLAAPVVIYGESGSGKERVARALHDHGRDPHGPFIAVNCGAFDRNLVCSELFGHERGAFTTALATRRGLFERASGGTLFLDEIAELPLDAQAMLLRVLETGELQRLGGDQTRHVRFRVLAASHQPLAKLVTAGRFRGDLFWRLFVLVIHVPSLAQRRDDIPALAAEILDELEQEVGYRLLNRAALELLAAYDWPGNVRQLKTVLRRAASATRLATLGRAHVAAALATEPPELAGKRRRQPLPSVAVVRDALRVSDGQLAPAARALGVPRSTLRELIRRTGGQ
ncbi:MAG: sigma-54-dependent Fis family transcriptional regulator [Deltaproteobacteria bacterium]|nr:sigma-54-dependent Fis family transcriptional regulator [Deltaproteobacteria bacterium]